MKMMLERYMGNPILEPIKSHPWEGLMVYNCGIVDTHGRVHIVYRAQGVKEGGSSLGYASSRDGFHIDERLDSPIFQREPSNSYELMGCEDPRLTIIGNQIIMAYTAYGKVPEMEERLGLPTPTSVQVRLASISVDDFVHKRWRWRKRWFPFFRVDNKDFALFPRKFEDLYVAYHRIPPYTWIAYSKDLKSWFGHDIVIAPKKEWEYYKVGAGAPPIETEKGWILIYHAVDREWVYRLGLAIADKEDPSKIICRHRKPILESREPYERVGIVPNVVFTCGAIVREGRLHVYYGGADTVACVASADLSEILSLF